MEKSDLIIIGAGPGGYETAVDAAASGLNVTLIERDLLGGTCLNRGCIPTKTLCRSAEVAMTLRNASEFGFAPVDGVVDYVKVAERKDRVVEELRAGVATLLKGVNVVTGEAKFISPAVVEVSGVQYTAPKIIVATGSAPAKLQIPGAELAMTSDDALSMTSIPKSMVIIGGGVIGMEFASIFASFGVEVTVIEYCKEILPPFDAEIAKRLRMSLKRRGITILTGTQVTAIEPGMTVKYLAKNKEQEIQVEQVLMAVGRVPVIPAGLQELGIKMNRRAIAVNDKMEILFDGDRQPSDVSLYAIGDVNGLCMLAHAATAHGKIALGHEQNLDAVPSAVFTVPECAMVGLTEDQCLNMSRNIKIGKATFRSNGKALAMGEPDGMVKIIADADTDALLGCHICGAHAADLVQEVATAITSGLKASAISSAIHGHPTLTEVVKAAVPV
ncbi:MAG: dihydrolipoyl dehydrogenase [Duncaniella sp.]|nr:dihydrolipoyl dehydrogenase [Duncaniella sp.]